MSIGPRSVLFVLLCLASGCFGAPRYVGKKSDHFDGERFYNPGRYEDRGFWDVVRWQLSSHAVDWPDWVQTPRFAPPPARVDEGIRITFINHASVLVQLGGKNILTDPVWSERVGPLSWLGPKRHKRVGVAFERLPRIDAVLISHNHYDHLDIPTLRRLSRRDRPVVFAGLGTAALLRRYDIAQGHDLDWWQSQDLGKVRITFTPAQHWSTRGLGDKNVNLWGSFYIVEGKHRVYFAGDTGRGKHFATIRQRLGAPSVALLPIGAYLPRWFMWPQHINPEEAVLAHRALGANRSVGIHWGTFKQADEGLNAPVKDLAKARLKHGVPEQSFIVLENGQSTYFSSF